jgi:homoserine kinase
MKYHNQTLIAPDNSPLPARSLTLRSALNPICAAFVKSVAEVRVPGSTSNLGPGFDCFGLALKLYLTVRATAAHESSELCRVTTTGAKENEALPRNAVNLIYRAMSFTAQREGATLPPVELIVHNEIPLASGLGSSAAAIVAGIKLSALLTEQQLSDQTILEYATEFEGHPDNVAASLYGGLVTNCTAGDAAVVSAKLNWPAQIRCIVVSPHSQLPTHVARAALPRTITRADAVHNLQRTALFVMACHSATSRPALGSNARSFAPALSRITRAGVGRSVGTSADARSTRHSVEWRWSKHCRVS